MSTNRSRLEQLPDGIPTQALAPYLNQIDLSHLVQSSKTTFTMFQQPLLAAKLLHFVQQVNYEQAEKIANHNQNLIFQDVLYKKTDNTYETISPLKFAFKVYDTPMCEMFFEKIKKNVGLKKLFMKQVREKTEHVNLEPLFSQYQKYKKQFDLYWIHQKISRDEIYKIWLETSQMQKEIPLNIWKEFSKSWSAETKGNIQNCEESPIPFTPTPGFAIQAKRIYRRIRAWPGKETTEYWRFRYWDRLELLTLENIYKQRIRDFNTFVRAQLVNEETELRYRTKCSRLAR